MSRHPAEVLRDPSMTGTAEEDVPDVLVGFEWFWDNKDPRRIVTPRGRYGYDLASQRAYAVGVLMGLRGDEDCPWAQFTAAWRSWADGWNQCRELEEPAASGAP